MHLELSNITKYYGALKANDDISFTLNSGEVLAIVGENGAGKSTIMKILYGLEQANSGRITLDGEELHLKSPLDAIRHHIGMVQQNFMLFPSFTVAENIVYNLEPRKYGLFSDFKEAARIVNELGKANGLQIDPQARVADLPVGLQQRVEILKVLYQDAHIVIFDEPTAVLTPGEVDDLLATIRRIADGGKACILITHKLAEVMKVADRVMIMRKGRKVGELKQSEVDIPTLSYLMIGRLLSERKVKEGVKGQRVLSVINGHKSAGGVKVLDSVNLHVDEGEIVGLAGVSGSGQSQLIDCLSGMSHLDGGQVLLEDKDITHLSVEEIRASQLAYVPEDRFAMGCAAAAPLDENGIMAYQRQKRFSRHALLKRKIIRDFVRNYLTKYQVAFSGLEQKAGSLSGGNLQKLIVARELERNTKMLVIAEPTRGVDIGAMEFIHDTLMKKRNGGDAIFLVSSELSEIMDLSDRIYVIYNGRIVAEKKRGEISSEALGEYMLGTKTDEAVTG